MSQSTQRLAEKAGYRNGPHGEGGEGIQTLVHPPAWSTRPNERPGAPFKTRSPGPGLAPWQIRRTTLLIEERLSEPLSIAELASAARLSSSHFAKAFKTSVGASPHFYIMGRRIVRAKQLMADPSQSLATIAFSCGLADQAHLSRLFRRMEGVTPNAWRRATRGVVAGLAA